MFAVDASNMLFPVVSSWGLRKVPCAIYIIYSIPCTVYYLPFNLHHTYGICPMILDIEGGFRLDSMSLPRCPIRGPPLAPSPNEMQ